MRSNLDKVEHVDILKYDFRIYFCFIPEDDGGLPVAKLFDYLRMMLI